MTEPSPPPNLPPKPPPLANQPPPPPVGNLWLNLLIGVSCAAFAFSGYWLYLGYRDNQRAEAQRQQDAANRGYLDGGLGAPELQTAADSALRFLRQRPEYAQEIGELLEPGKPFEYRVETTNELGHPDDLKFRMTLRGAKSHAWYDTIVRKAGDRWDLLSAQLTVPDNKAPEGRRVIHLLDPAPAPVLPPAPAPPPAMEPPPPSPPPATP